MTFLCLSKETGDSRKNTQFLWEQQTWYKFRKAKKYWNSGQHIPDVLSACWTISWYSHVVGRTQNTVKQCEKWHFSNWNTMNFICLPGNSQPLPYLYIHIYVCVSLLDLIKPPYFVGWITFFKVKSKKSQRNQDIGVFLTEISIDTLWWTNIAIENGHL
jgi:hypothetical protein